MKNIKLRIVYLILGSALLLFALFMLAVNLIIPAHFVREAKKALISEAQYQNRTIPYTDDESFFDDEWSDAEEHFLTPSIVFLELDNANQSSGWNRDAYRLEKKLLEYYTGRELSLNQCYTFKTDRHHLIFMSVQEEQADWGKPYAYIMYIDIGPITRYIVRLTGCSLRYCWRSPPSCACWGSASAEILKRRRSGSKPSSRMPPTS